MRKRIINNLPEVKHLQQELEKYKTHHPPGHFYSPVPDRAELKKNAARIFDRSKKEIPGIDLREKEQLELLEKFAELYKDQPFTRAKTTGNRYYFENEYFSFTDGLMLHCMLRHLRPSQVIEVGSGFSSLVTMDTNEKFLDGKTSCTFIEPFPERLLANTKDAPGRFSLIEKFVQDVPLSEFKKLRSGDVLFIDSTHVSKAGSDVNYLFFEVLPALEKGVYIHVHDVFYPFEYPESWLMKGFAWNEDYLLRAFLQFNDTFEIVLFNTFVVAFHEDWFKAHMPLCLENSGGSIWLRKTK